VDVIPHSTRAPLLAAADALAIVAFVTVGLVSHRHGVSATGYARDALPLLGGWFGVALALRTYRAGGTRRLLATWAVGIPLGVLIRALVLGRSLNGSELAFLGVTLAFSLLFVLGLRAALGAALAQRVAKP
jgi:hypothetical protein